MERKQVWRRRAVLAAFAFSVAVTAALTVIGTVLVFAHSCDSLGVRPWN